MSDIGQEATGMVIPQSQMIGTQLYPPWLLAIYSALANPPLAVFLYGINIQRRGNKAAGIILKTVAALAIVLMTIAAALETRMKGVHLMLFGIVVGLSLYRIEERPYRISISQGAKPARWWPPILFILAQAAAVIAISYFHDNPE
jgi:hypothetical protein